MSFPREPFAGPAAAAALGAGALCLGAFLALGGAVRGWALLGWAIAGLSGIVAGAWVAKSHGRPGQDFLFRFAASVVARFTVYSIGLLGVVRSGTDGVPPYLAGLAVGYVPVQAYEMIWFARRTGGK